MAGKNIILIGIGEIGGLIARGFLRLGYSVHPVDRHGLSVGRDRATRPGGRRDGRKGPAARAGRDSARLARALDHAWTLGIELRLMQKQQTETSTA